MTSVISMYMRCVQLVVDMRFGAGFSQGDEEIALDEAKG